MSVRVRLVRKDDPKKFLVVHSIDAKEILARPDCEWQPATEQVAETLARKRKVPTPEELELALTEGRSMLDNDAIEAQLEKTGVIRGTASTERSTRGGPSTKTK